MQNSINFYSAWKSQIIDKKLFEEKPKFQLGICGEEHPGQIQKYCVQQEHHYPTCAILTWSGSTELFHWKQTQKIYVKPRSNHNFQEKFHNF